MLATVVVTCSTCAYFDNGKCKRNPPTIKQDGTADWPTITSPATENCGEGR